MSLFDGIASAFSRPQPGFRQTLRSALKRRVGVPTISAALDRLHGNGFEPRLVFDVGAHEGEFTRDCLRRWPAAAVACFEVLERPLGELRRLARVSPLVTVHETLLGATTRSSVPFHEAETASSILSEHHAQGFPVRERPMTTVDEIVRAAHGGVAPALLKLDVQGYELEVLKGAEAALRNAEVVLVEVNLLDIHAGVPLLADLVAWLAERRWVAYDVCGLTRRPLDHALWQADFIFVPATSRLRADKRWRTT